jgi:8-oxo-dGTP pyrophosphatase MutT (NUDIX family)
MLRMRMTSLLRHIAACNNAVLPGPRLRFRIGAATVGWVLPAFARLLTDFPDITADRQAVTLAAHAAGTLPAIARSLAERGVMRFRREAFDVRAAPGQPVLTTIDRGALPKFGIQAEGIHLDGLVATPDGPHLWVARRAADKALDPGKLDHITAGGIPAGLTPWDTLIKEAAEEAAIPAALAANATPTGTLVYAMDRPEGLRRDLLHCYEVTLPADFVPTAADGEVESFELWPLPRALDAVRNSDAFKFNVNLVLIALFLRHGMFAEPEAQELRTALQARQAALF